MKKVLMFAVVLILIGVLLTACAGNSAIEQIIQATRMALMIQQTSEAMGQSQAQPAQQQQPAEVQAPLPTYTAYPTYTSAPQNQVGAQEQAPTTAPVPTEEPVTSQSFEEWMEDVDILLYDDMLGMAVTHPIENAIDGLGLGANTVNVGDAMGDFLANMNSATEWDLIIVGGESRDSISGEYFDVLADQIDRGSSIVIEIWYIDDISYGRIQPVMQRCGIAFHRDWWRGANSNLNEFLVYLLEPGDPLFSQPNTIGMLIPYDVMWTADVGDTVKINAGSDAVLLAGAQAKEHNSYGLIAECLDGRMIWQLFSTHDYKHQEMVNLWQNYIYNALMARYEYIN